MAASSQHLQQNDDHVNDLMFTNMKFLEFETNNLCLLIKFV